jgi:protein Mpv17
MAGIWAAYNRALAAQPLLVKAATSFVGFTVGDILAQKFIDPDKEYDVNRTLRLGSFGALIHGPTGHFFYGFLDKQLPGTAATTVVSKVAIDQLIWNPIFGVMFFSYLGLTEGKTVDQIQTKIKNDLQTAVMGSWAVWIPAHTINFKFVPSSQRLLYINSIQIGYNVFLSFLGNKGAAKEPGQEVGELRAGARELKSDAHDNAQWTAGKADDFVRDSNENAKAAARDVKSGARDVKHDIKSSARDVKESARDAKRDASYEAKADVQGVKDWYNDNAAAAGEDVREAKEAMKSDVKEAKSSIRQAAHDAKEKLKSDLQGVHTPRDKHEKVAAYDKSTSSSSSSSANSLKPKRDGWGSSSGRSDGTDLTLSKPDFSNKDKPDLSNEALAQPDSTNRR